MHRLQELVQRNATVLEHGANLHSELLAALAALVQAVADAHVPQSPALEQEVQSLARVNEQLWDIEDRIREHESRQQFGPSFIELARSVYFRNDERAAIKRRINALLHAAIIEEKSYTPYR